MNIPLLQLHTGRLALIFRLPMGRSFRSPVTVTLLPSTVKRAKEFATAVICTVDYRDSNQSVKAKIQDDHFISKLGEEAVKVVFKSRGASVVGPDYMIYKGKNKSWNADLVVNDLDVAVKTQKKSAADKYGLSWTFQHSEVRMDPILKNPEAWVCFVEVNDADAKYRCIVFPPVKIKMLPFREPRLKHLKGKKKVVYAGDLSAGSAFLTAAFRLA
jgi:hypothetical protein